MLPALSPSAIDLPPASSSPHARFNLFMLFSLLGADALPEVDLTDHKFRIFGQKKPQQEKKKMSPLPPELYKGSHCPGAGSGPGNYFESHRHTQRWGDACESTLRPQIPGSSEGLSLLFVQVKDAEMNLSSE